MNTYRVAENTSNCKTWDVWFFRKPLSNDLARLTGTISSRFLVVISQSLQEKVLVFCLLLWPQLFWFSKHQFFLRLHSFKGSQLGSDLPAGRSVYSFYSMLLTCPLYQWKKKQPTTKTESCTSEENLKSEHTLIQWPDVLKMYEKPFKLHALDLISFHDQINIYSQNSCLSTLCKSCRELSASFSSLSSYYLVKQLTQTLFVTSYTRMCFLLACSCSTFSLLFPSLGPQILSDSQQVQNCTVVVVFHAWL